MEVLKIGPWITKLMTKRDKEKKRQHHHHQQQKTPDKIASAVSIYHIPG